VTGFILGIALAAFVGSIVLTLVMLGIGRRLGLKDSGGVGAHKKGAIHRSEERRVGKECRSRWSPYH